MALSDLKDFAQLVKGLAQTSVAVTGQLDFFDDEWAGTANFNPTSQNVGTEKFDQLTLDAVFGTNVFTPTEFENLMAAFEAWRSGIHANSKLMRRLANATITT